MYSCFSYVMGCLLSPSTSSPSSFVCFPISFNLSLTCPYSCKLSKMSMLPPPRSPCALIMPCRLRVVVYKQISDKRTDIDSVRHKFHPALVITRMAHLKDSDWMYTYMNFVWLSESNRRTDLAQTSICYDGYFPLGSHEMKERDRGGGGRD